MRDLVPERVINETSPAGFSLVLSLHRESSIVSSGRATFPNETFQVFRDSQVHRVDCSYLHRDSKLKSSRPVDIPGKRERKETSGGGSVKVNRLRRKLAEWSKERFVGLCFSLSGPFLATVNDKKRLYSRGRKL